MAEESGVAAVDRALSLLDAFQETDYSLTLTELSRRTNLYKSTALRLAESLIKARYLYRLPDGSYQIGSRPFTLGALYQRQFRSAEYVPAFLRRIVEEVGESASFYVYENGGRLCLHRVDASQQVILDSVREGNWRPLQGGATGMVIQAYHQPDATGAQAVRDRLWAASFGGPHPEMAAVAVPVFATGEKFMGALSVSGPRYRFEEKGVAPMLPALMQAARELTQLLGGDASIYDQAQPVDQADAAS